MGLLDNDREYTPRYSRKKYRKRYTEEENLSALNNLDREEVTDDFSDSPHLDT